jgi:ribonuclease-3
MSHEECISKAEEHLGIVFDNKAILRKALTHSSFAYEAGTESEMYERLEFLGDAVLNFVITDFIFHRFPNLNEGDLAKIRANLVNSQVLADLAAQICLGECILLGRGAELSGGRERTSILGDCFEAVLGAIYLDKGVGVAREFVLRRFKDIILKVVASGRLSDDKTALQEYTVSKFGVMPKYEIIKEEGPVHKRTFYAEVSISDKAWGVGNARSKKKAELAAAKKAMEALAGEEAESAKKARKKKA